MRLGLDLRLLGLILAATLVLSGCGLIPQEKPNGVERAVPAATRSSQAPHISPAKQPIKEGAPEETALPATRPPMPVKPPSIQGSGG
jgi:hypothetical protein